MTAMSAEKAELQALYAKLREAGLDRIHFTFNENASVEDRIVEAKRIMSTILDGSFTFNDYEIITELGMEMQST